MADGTLQRQRLPDALRPGYVLPDELDLAQRIRLTLEYGARLRFKGADGKEAGNWGESLVRDESVVLADMAAFPAERLYARFQREAPGATSARLLEFLWHLALRMDHWLKHLQGHETPSAKTLARSIEDEIQRGLGDRLWRSLAIRHPSQERIRVYPWHAAWGLPADPPPPASPEKIRQLLRSYATEAFQSTRSLQAAAWSALPASLNSGVHDPSSALLLAFLQLLQKAHGTLNRFPDRLASFYHEDMLHMRPRPPAREQAHLLLSPDPLLGNAVDIPVGTLFLAGQDTQGNDLTFASDRPITLSDTRVGALCTLRMERWGANSPEWELGFSTRAKAELLPMQELGMPGSASDWWPLFGGQAKGSAGRGQDARFGWAIASPLLDLREGIRNIQIELRFAHPASGDSALMASLRSALENRNEPWLTQVFLRYERLAGRTGSEAGAMASSSFQRGGMAGLAGDMRLRHLLAHSLLAQDRPTFSHRLGLLFSAWLVAPEPLLPEDLQALRAHAGEVWKGRTFSAVDVDDPLSLIFGQRPPERDLIFDRVFRGVWAGRISSEEGWLALDEIYVSRGSRQDSLSGGCLILEASLGPEQPAATPCIPAIHGAQWPEEAMLQLELQTHTRIFCHSLLRELVIEDAELSVSVQGLRDVALNNQLGRLDPGRPFQPFGPLPAKGDYLVLGGSELARKPLQNLEVHIRWAGIPAAGGGFPEHYTHYPGAWDNSGFQVRTSLLKDGHWNPGQGAPLPLFTSEPSSRRAASEQTLRLDPSDLARHHKASWHPQDSAGMEFGRKSRNGFFRFELSAPEEAFGHTMHGRLLTEVLTRNARFKRQDPLPDRPYTPVIEQIRVDYRAARMLRLPQAGTEARPGQDRLFHLHAFGHEEIRPSGKTRRWPMLPRIDHDGNLFIGLESRDPRGMLSLFFNLRAESAKEGFGAPRSTPRWSVWTRQGWRMLSAVEIVSDDTQGFLRSGCVCLDLPGDLAPGCPRLPEGFWWLRLGTDWDFEGFAGLRGVYAHGVSASRITPRPREDQDHPLPEGSIRQPMLPIPGLQSVFQVGPSFGVRSTDSPGQVRVRATERLRHKGRASLPGDYERILLDTFPEVYKATCFAHHQRTGRTGPLATQAPGQVVVVVVPTPPQGSSFHSAHGPKLDAATLERMAECLRHRATPSASISVRNASYERIQVRCGVRLVRGSHPGTCLRILNDAIVRYLSPWHNEGYAADFDWVVRTEDLEVLLRSQPCVEAVGQISLLHIVRDDDGAHWMDDTARKSAEEWHEAVVKPAAPWSLALPMPHHLLEIVENPAAMLPRPTGVRGLEIGQTFILSR